ncbi:hypothetical protein BST99_04300 [Aureicoccus marinus]|uniref:DUF4258 domain-containing protein n=1 Tax=Aureicoccus marinus TaxID=754435 RepID=A0A2S7T6A5_9FLAO|nr:hypothetical protein BST99_04300 [Aureicoccus marinus]
MVLGRRILFYLFGVGLGCVLVVFILKQKNGGKAVKYCYLPNCRVLKDLRSKPLVLNENIQSKDTSGISEALLDGDILFSESDTRKEPCGEYRIEWEQYQLHVANCSTEVKVLNWKALP